MTVAARASTLFADVDAECIPDAPIGQQTWFKIGGRADVLVIPRTIDALATIVSRLSRDGLPMRVLGAGANLLVDDDGIDGVVLSLSAKAFSAMDVERGGANSLIRVGAGKDLFTLLNELARSGLAGLNQLAGIPGSVGGAIRMNAGGHFGDTAQAVQSAEMILASGAKATFLKDALHFNYRHSGLPAGIVTSATFHVDPTDPTLVRQKHAEIFSWKKSRQPFRENSAGCMYKNPIDRATLERVSAGKLIDSAGLKGLAVGGASVSAHHANFFVVQAGALASDVAQLSEVVSDRVFDHCGIRLEREVVFWKRGGDE